MPKNIQFQDELHERRQKSYILIGCVAFFFLVLIIRLFYLQVIQAQMHIEMSKANQSRYKVLKAPRGRIFDRNGIELANNRPSYSLCVLPYKMEKKVDIVSKLLQIVDSSREPIFDSLELVNRIKKAHMRRFETTRLKEDISMDIVSIIEEHAMELPGVLVQTEARREYPLGPTTFHVLGYMSEIPEELFDSLREEEYHYGDMIGKAGIEKQYESVLRGRDGFEYIEVNAYGRSLGPIALMPRLAPVPGDDLYLSIDARLQKVACDSFPKAFKGGVIALNPQTGEVLTMFSNPSVDPNIFSQAATIRSKSWAVAACDSNMPLNNRTVTGTYSPGSTFKVIAGLAGIASGRINPEATMPVPCRGVYYFGGMKKHCLGKHGAMKFVDALRVSCNIYFYQVGLMVGNKIINSYAEQLGLGSASGLDFPVEHSGFLSGEEAYNKRFAVRKWRWTRGLDLDHAIGQTELITPLQLAQMIGAVGNGKAIHRPFLLKEERSYDGILIRKTKPVVTHELHIDSTVIELLRKSMESVIAAGTGRRASIKGVPIGGKTGSAQNPQGEKTHALFGACAPLDNPVIAVGAVAENAGHGGSISAPIVGAVFRHYFTQTPEGKEITARYGTQDEKTRPAEE